MRTYSSPKIDLIDANAVIAFLEIPKNFEALMPDNIQSFEASDQEFKFQLTGMPIIHLKKMNSGNDLFYQNQGGSIAFGLYFQIHNNTLTFEVRGEINSMVNMMLSKPLTNLLTTFSSKISKKGL